ncbi:hypothetical protein C7B77_23825 [Chamaesiphon polymorphus CCALA 037]|uniref:Uncharacterized protein n=1 Tax=Chamaesiphon polymorphus CCALA 037 TaxID=2107692 RepID=A0A2T1FUA2_9CYAN|nr:hypothetical protein C7B77_23825 [Chamaesiphon polymorphus CCALA 037]
MAAQVLVFGVSGHQFSEDIVNIDSTKKHQLVKLMPGLRLLGEREITKTVTLHFYQAKRQGFSSDRLAASKLRDEKLPAI